MRLVSDAELAPVVARLVEGEPPLDEYRPSSARHPTAGRSLRNYVALTDSTELAGELGLTENERFWSRYYRYARFVRGWQAAEGYDAGLEQSVFKLLEVGVEYGTALDPLPEVEAAVVRDAAIPAR